MHKISRGKCTYYIFLVLLFSFNAFTQEDSSKSTFSSLEITLLVGPSFNSIPTLGSSFFIELRSSISSKLDLKLSIGYSKIYNDDAYEQRSYRFVSFGEYARYHTILNSINRIEYTLIPINIGAELMFFNTKFSPFVGIDVGYNLSKSIADGLTHDGIAGTYTTVNEIPEAYRKLAPPLDGGSSFTFGLEFGVQYLFTSWFGLNLRYIFRYNNSIINCNQILAGFTI